MSAITRRRPATDTSLILGGMPKVHLLPREVSDGQRTRALRRRLLAVLVMIIVIAILATVGATFALFAANAQLADEQARSALVAASRAKYSDVTKLHGQVDQIVTSQPLAAAGEILWAPYLQEIQNSLPAGTTITAFTASIATAATVQDSLIPAHVADVKITADSPQQPISDWLDNLAKVKGFVAAVPGSVTLVDVTGHYTVEVDLLVNSDALSGRFDPSKEAKK